MKFTLAVVVAAAASANALSDCILSCQTTAASSAGCDSDYNSTVCYCDNEDFATDVKACLYQEACSSDVSVFYEYRSDACGDDTAASTDDTDDTVDDQGGYLGTCILGCQESVAVTAGCTTSDYNDTTCYCDNDDFASDVKVCLYQNCSSEVSVFYNYRADICGGDNATEYKDSQETADATAGIASSTASSTSSSSTSTTSATSGAARDLVFVSGLAGFVALAMMFVC